MHVGQYKLPLRRTQPYRYETPFGRMTRMTVVISISALQPARFKANKGRHQLWVVGQGVAEYLSQGLPIERPRVNGRDY
ncbi:hypothetical protein D9M69_699710 [compost metagenome]